jgi:hypothetical protein
MAAASFDTQIQQHPGQQIFQAVVEENYDSLVKIFAVNARNSLVSYMSMKSRWERQQESMAKSGESKFDWFCYCCRCCRGLYFFLFYRSATNQMVALFASNSRSRLASHIP